MKTFNIRYRNIEKLEDFFKAHDLASFENTLVQIFTSFRTSSRSLKLAKSIQSLLPHATVVGASTDGEIMDGKILVDNTVISITIFEKTTVNMVLLPPNDEKKLASSIAATLLQKETKVLLLFCAFNALNTQSLLDSLYHDNSISDELLISGALAADGGRFSEAYVFNAQEVLERGLIAVTLSGSTLLASQYYLHDWEPISRKFKVNSSNGTLLSRLDGKEAASLYAHYIAEEKEENLAYLSLQFPFISKAITKQIIAKEEGSLRFTSSVKRGEVLQLSFANIEKIQARLEELYLTLLEMPIESIFLYASSARRRFIAPFSQREVETLSQLGTCSGFFGYGEFFSVKKGMAIFSQSMTVLVLSEVDTLAISSKKQIAHSHHENSDFQTLKALTKIAQVSAKESEELNKALERRIKEGVKDNRKKDSIMIHNSKLAQLGEMLGLIAHQWRQPLSAISATASGMQIKFELDNWSKEYVKESLEHIQEYVQHLSTTIDDFTNFFKPSKKKESVLLRELIKKSLFIMSPMLTKENVTVLKKYSSDVKVETYPNEVIQVLLNLIKNAVSVQVKREIDHPEIYINEYEDQGRHIIEVSDNAGGIDESILERIFEPYFSTQNSTDSMGLGLYMSKFIIEDSCSGKLEVQNIKEGVKFTIIL